ncbi:MAG: SDR family oxidoreductase [Bryobacteraceae bacterium]|jgi:NAD(P)-dependent dehydrogenase (short-subunit alcohol dehydrogenase family)
MDFGNRVAIVTGGASGIGAAAAGLLNQRGARVFVLDVSDAASGLPAFQADVARFDQVQAAVDGIAAQAGGIDIVVAAAGIQAYGTALTTTDADWDRVLDINLRGVWNVARAAIPHMRGRGGSIVVVSSVQALATQRNVFAYAVSKHALTGLTRSMALDFAADGIRVNEVCPGSVDTPMFAASAALDPDPNSVYEACARMHPLGRIAKAEEIAEVIAFLAHPGASFVTGAVWTVDGGLLTLIGGVPKVSK